MEEPTQEGSTLADIDPKLLQQFIRKMQKENQENKNIVIKEWDVGVDNKRRITHDFYKGKEFCSIRTWYTDKDTGELKPGKGVSFDYEEIDDIIQGLEELKVHLEETTPEGEEEPDGTQD